MCKPRYLITLPLFWYGCFFTGERAAPGCAWEAATTPPLPHRRGGDRPRSRQDTDGGTEGGGATSGLSQTAKKPAGKPT